MTVDLRKDERELKSHLARQVNAYAAACSKDSSLPKASAVEVGYQFDQSGWFFMHFDTRPKHDRDGEWTAFLDREPFSRDLLERPEWYEACTAEGDLTFIMPDGNRRVLPDGVAEEEVAALLGEFIKRLMLDAKKEGIFEKLPKPQCQLDIEEFNGHWAWPDYDELGKSNLS